jgi:hypothetical protein
MARPIVLSNGELHVGINDTGLVHDFYFPYVGFENHSAGQDMRHRVGIWVDGAISWLDTDESWTFDFSYPHSALIGHTVAKNNRIGIQLEFDDCVDAQMSAFLTATFACLCTRRSLLVIRVVTLTLGNTCLIAMPSCIIVDVVPLLSLGCVTTSRLTNILLDYLVLKDMKARFVMPMMVS